MAHLLLEVEAELGADREQLALLVGPLEAPLQVVGALAGVIVVTHSVVRNPLDDPDAFFQDSAGLLEGKRDPDSMLVGALVSLYVTFAAVAATFSFGA